MVTEVRASLSEMDSPVTTEHLKQYQEQGFFVLESVIPEAHLEMLRHACAEIMAQIDEKAVAAGNSRPLKYFFSLWDEAEGANPVKDAARAQVREYVFSDLMARILRPILGDTLYLSFEQFVVKAAEKGAPFAWHQDAAYVSAPHEPYVACWSALDAVNEENGTVYLLPYDRAGTRELLPHHKAQDDFDLIGYTGDDPGVPVITPAGSIAVFSSRVLHRSGLNTTPNQRRIYLPQYSSAPVLKENGEPYYIAEPFPL